MTSLLERLQTLEDPRDPRGQLYPIVLLLTLALVATLAGGPKKRSRSCLAKKQCGTRKMHPGILESIGDLEGFGRAIST